MELIERIEQFTQDGRSFMYIDYSGIRTNEDFLEFIAFIEPQIAKYPEASLYMITNIEDIRFDSKSREIITKHLEHNKPYIKYSVIIGLDGIKKVMINNIFKMVKRENVYFAFSKEKAIEWLMER